MSDNGRITWTTERRRLSDLTPWPRNPRQIRKEQADRLAASFNEFGQVETLAIGPDGELYNGHQRLNVLAQQHGPDHEVEVRVSSRPLSEKEREKLTVYLHKGAAGEWDFDVLANEFDLGDLLDWGFSERDLDLDMWPSDEPPEDPGPDLDRAAELQEKWGVESGQLWRLGDHRVICGDCTDAETVARVMGGGRAAVMVTSPPYFVGKSYERDSQWGEHLRLLREYPATCSNYMMDAFAIVIFNEQYPHPRSLWCLTRGGFLKAGFDFFDYRAWKRPTRLPIYATTQPRHAGGLEFAHTYRIGQPAMTLRAPELSRESVWQTGGPERLGHDAPFPVELVEIICRVYSDEAALVLDPFLGSGTTLIACEQLGRRCRGVEIEPKYVAVTLERWHEMTGEMPEILESYE